jgi:dolichyl-phosphate beta-glucosyltransferase
MRHLGIRGEVGASMYLSVVIPAYNEELRIGKTLREIQTYLQRQPYSAEIIVVDDGSQDGTAPSVRAFEATRPPIYLLQNGRNRGKGFSVRQGFLRAQGECLLFSDADLSTPIEEVEKLFAALRERCEVAIGSRALPGSRVEVHQPRYREHLGRLFNLFVQLLAVPGIQDTQCGFKCFTREAALAICQRMTAERFGFDVEMLYLARLLGYRVREVPVVWRHSPQTRVRVWRDSVSMLGDLWRIRWNDLWGRYDRPARKAMRCHGGASGVLVTDGTSATQGANVSEENSRTSPRIPHP